MCDDPGCTTHAGPIMKPVAGKVRHCDTPLMNSECPYLELGCLGCTLNALIDVSVGETSNLLAGVFPTKNMVEVCDCGQPFPENGYCPFCGAHQRHPGE
jgi:hypothetical protein